ncbi:HDIG domain-containing protein [Desulfococcaceae bacterium HSG8]|nr:HDIG domain-containing protein [Desulfococcaceae bacterium HSG8]
MSNYLKKEKKKSKKKDSVRNFFASGSVVRWGLLAVVMSISTIILYPNLIATKDHYYELGDVAQRDIKAPRDFYIINENATATARGEAAKNVLTVYDRDDTLLPKLIQQLNEAFEDMRKIFEAGEKEEKPNAAAPEIADKQLTNQEKITDPSVSADHELSLHERVLYMKKGFEKKIGIPVDDEAFALLEKEKFSKEIPDTIIQIIAGILENGVVANKELLIQEKGIKLRTIGTGEEVRISSLKQLKQFYGPEQYKEMVRIIATPLVKGVNKSVVPVIVGLSQRLIRPNITLNRSETEERKKRAAEKIKPIRYRIKAGEMILREGERATELQLLKLETLNAERKEDRIYVRSIGAIAIILCLLLITYTLHANRQNNTLLGQNKDILFIGTILVAFFFLPKISAILFESLTHRGPFSISESSLSFGIPLAASAMTICLFMGLDAAISFAIVIAVCTAIIFQNRFEIFIYFLLSCIMGAYWMQDCRERKIFITAGLKLGFLNAVLATAVNAYIGSYMGGDFLGEWAVEFLWDWVFAFMGGIGAGIITAGLAPLLEIAFGYTTDITLHELANLERPILRRLMIEAPGTYHHSVVVGSMVEAAASEIGANPLLAKVCGYYHDIGKIRKPLYFIENQTDGKNRHDKLAPSMSALILISHVKNGVETAKENKLGQVICDTIQQHHGTSLIRFFYEKAKQCKGEDSVNIDDFRYPGPKPQTREAGLVMLADVVEAASRTLDNPTPSRIQGHVQKLINAIFSDGQLDNCELTLKDLHNIAKSFNKILNGIHHHRVEYPESGSGGNGKEKKEGKKEKREKKEKKEKNGHSDSQHTKQPEDRSGKNTEDSSGRLKRLGVS